MAGFIVQKLLSSRTDLYCSQGEISGGCANYAAAAALSILGIIGTRPAFRFNRKSPISFNLLRSLSVFELQTPFSGPSMPRFAVLLACSLLLSACADATVPHHTPPQDPPDYKGVPTDTTPPVMIIAPAKPEQPQ